ncbi:MAG TPA: 4-hydroxythreonine-4-phosphate dehydrogenase PdxA [Polyangiaceae bacterium]|nr:4-hydroxythreonine-4-phosphate dehydrogenase PdxA [Polyangiaceae bacterium]
MLVVSIGCPAGIGPEVSVRAAAQLRGEACVLVGDWGTIEHAAQLAGVSPKRFTAYREGKLDARKIHILGVGPKLEVKDRQSERVTPNAGRAQLAYIEAAYELAKSQRGAALVTGPVSKAAIAGCGLVRARKFLGHTEWLQAMDGANVAIMCFASKDLVTSLVTTHLPLSRVSGAITKEKVCAATVQLGKLLQAMGRVQPTVSVCSLNPHAGESELLGKEEARAIIPGIALAQKQLGKKVTVQGPIGAETAYRKAYAARGKSSAPGVVAMYHDQATIPLKLVSFGEAVNVTMGLSIVRTSVDHGTAYDIAWKGVADASGMLSAMQLAQRLLTGA